MKVLAAAGRIVLVGAGPGDPGLITVKGDRRLRRADVVVYDRLVDLRLLEVTPTKCEKICVGKKGGHYSFPQDKINELLVNRARQGKQVVRLKGGDPFFLGRGGEEALYAVRHGIPCEVVPGVSSAWAAPAAAGIPLTQRGISSSLTILSGHQASGSDRAIAWAPTVAASDTLVILMPLQHLRHIVSQLVLHGKPLDTPAAVIQSGTLGNQTEALATLRNIVAESLRVGIESPALLVVGEVVNLASRLAGLKRFFADREQGPWQVRNSKSENF